MWFNYFRLHPSWLKSKFIRARYLPLLGQYSLPNLPIFTNLSDQLNISSMLNHDVSFHIFAAGNLAHAGSQRKTAKVMNCCLSKWIFHTFSYIPIRYLRLGPVMYWDNVLVNWISTIYSQLSLPQAGSKFNTSPCASSWWSLEWVWYQSVKRKNSDDSRDRVLPPLSR